MRHFCHSFQFFLWTNNPESQPLRSLSCLSVNAVSLPPIRQKTMQTAWGELTQPTPSNHIFFSFPLSFLSSQLKKVLTDFKANLPLSTWLWIYFCPLYPFPSLLSLSYHPVHLHLPRTQAVTSQHVPACSIPWKAAPMGPPGIHHLPCISQTPALWASSPLC